MIRIEEGGCRDTAKPGVLGKVAGRADLLKSTNKPPATRAALVCHNQNLNDVKNKYKPWLVQTDFRNQLVER